MTGIWHSRNFWRLFITYGLLVVCSIGVLGTVLVSQVEQSFIEQTRFNLRYPAVVVRERFRPSRGEGPGPDQGTDGPLKKSLADLQSSYMVHIALFKPDGRVLVDTERTGDEYEGEDYSGFQEIGDARNGIAGIPVRHYSQFSRHEMMYLVLSLPPESPVGLIRVGMSVDKIRDQVAGMRDTVWTTAAVTGAVALLLAFWLAQRTAKPLQALTRGAERIAAGQFGHQVAAKGQDEVGQLGRAFNRMSEHLAEQFTQLEDDREKLRRLEALRRDFVANVSHELKTPLAVIKACVETLLDGAADDPKVCVSFLQQVAEQAEHLQALILDLLSLARVESGAEAFEFQEVALDEVVRNCLQRHRSRAEAKGQALETVPPEGNSAASLAAWADEEAVRQILDNLVDNALKYTPEGGRIRVRWWAEDGQACVEVADTGVGIPEADLPRVFERFYRVDKARSRELGGSGLGLAIVKHLAQAMHGSVAAASRPGQGSTLTVRLPQATQVPSYELRVMSYEEPTRAAGTSSGTYNS